MATAKKATARGGSYSASDIQVLEGLEPVRKRPAMYIGGTDLTGYHHLLWEIVDNSVDEVINGYADRVEVTLHKVLGKRSPDEQVVELTGMARERRGADEIEPLVARRPKIGIDAPEVDMIAAPLEVSD